MPYGQPGACRSSYDFMPIIIRFPSISAVALFSLGSFLVASEPAAEWDFQGKEPLKDARGGLVAILDESGVPGTVEVVAGAVTFQPKGEGVEAHGGVLIIPWSDLTARCKDGFPSGGILSHAELDGDGLQTQISSPLPLPKNGRSAILKHCPYEAIPTPKSRLGSCYFPCGFLPVLVFR